MVLMPPIRARTRVWSRRGILLTPVSLWAQSRHLFPAERVKYPDPATEFDVFRLTDPRHASLLPPSHGRIFSRRGNFLLHASDRTGVFQAFALDLRNWQIRQLTEAAGLDPRSLCLTFDERNLCYAGGASIFSVPVAGGHEKEVYKFEGEHKRGSGLATIPDLSTVLFAEDGIRLRAVSMLKPGARTVAENKEGVFDPRPRPRRASVLYRTSSGDLWLAHLDGSRNFRLKLAESATGPAHWSPDGRTVLYLQSGALREHNPDSAEDRLIGPTSGYVGFSLNADASVFVGASGSKAQPFVLLMLRVVRRELALCEHKSGDPASVAPVFSLDSQRIFFQSDRHGKPALYAMQIERLIEKTEVEKSGTVD
jgi:oligogalacturonide lyase